MEFLLLPGNRKGYARRNDNIQGGGGELLISSRDRSQSLPKTLPFAH